MVSQDQIKPVKQEIKQNPKEEIINFMCKYIKSTQIGIDTSKEAQEYDETVQNLRDFLQYLEDKQIINCKNLENNKEEMNNLIKDLMKLDLKKFNSKQRLQNKQSPIQNQTPSNDTTQRKSSVDYFSVPKQVQQNI